MAAFSWGGGGGQAGRRAGGRGSTATPGPNLEPYSAWVRLLLSVRFFLLVATLTLALFGALRGRRYRRLGCRLARRRERVPARAKQGHA